jgi:uncharacterized lipoprotein YajG
MREIDLIAEADVRARQYLAEIESRPPFPTLAAREALTALLEELP